MTAGYSGTPLAKKLGIKPGFRIYVENGPGHYMKLIAPLPEAVSFVQRPGDQLNMIHLFTQEAGSLAAKLKDGMRRIVPDGMIWVSWPKKASGVATDLTEDGVRAVALAHGLVDVRVCAVDEVWSGLKLVRRLKDRRK